MIIGRPSENEEIYWLGKMVVDETDAIRYLIEEYCEKDGTLFSFMHTDVTLLETGHLQIDVNYLNLDNDKIYSWTEVYKDRTHTLDEFGQIMAETIRRAIHDKVKDEYCFVFQVE